MGAVHVLAVYEGLETAVSADQPLVGAVDPLWSHQRTMGAAHLYDVHEERGARYLAAPKEEVK